MASSGPQPHRFRRAILATAVVAMVTWWGLGLPYSLYAWLLDEKQLRWVLICYAWEVPVAGLLGPVLFPQLWFRAIERRWDDTFPEGADAPIDPAAAAALERTILDFPARVAWVFLLTSLVGYGVGALQVRQFAELPDTEVYKIIALGLATGLVGALFSFLYLESLLEPLVRRLGTVAPGVSPAGRRVPLYAKVFACSLVMTVTALLLLGAIAYSRGERVLEEELGRRAVAEARHIAAALADDGERGADRGWWRGRTAAMPLGPSGAAFLVEADGTIVGGSAQGRHLRDERFRPEITYGILSGDGGHLVD
ncbi:MAG TPA: hypothetical protein VKA21_12480, partial [Candidatus Binatia bacterium]|nr:hypothetical protein [Candidatus Binatia bacterium]